MLHTEWTLEALGALPLDPPARMRTALALSALVQGLALGPCTRCAPSGTVTCAMRTGGRRSRPKLTICSGAVTFPRSEEHTSELQSRGHLVCRLLLEKK